MTLQKIPNSIFFERTLQENPSSKKFQIISEVVAGAENFASRSSTILPSFHYKIFVHSIVVKSFFLVKINTFEFGTCFKKYKKKLVKKDSGMWILFLYISFIIKCE